jgi:hypothetical protein
MSEDIPVCRDRQLPFDLALQAGRACALINPANAVPRHALANVASRYSMHLPIHPEHTALLNSAYWGVRGVHCTVGFLEPVPADFQQHFLLHANAWGQYANVRFELAPAGQVAMVRVTCRGDGYWSYLGPQIMTIPANQPTMSLQDFDRGMPESEWVRVVRHEVGHTLGLLHEHSLPEIISLLDPEAVIADFSASQGWSRQMIIEQILTPPAPGTYRVGKPSTASIMCYQFPAKDTKSRRPIPGGLDITPDDGAFVGSLYPKASGLKPMTVEEILARIINVL